jgi:formamidopyrimidine-DNA glycosylase
MPELPEVEITARRLSRALEGATVESAMAPGLATLKTFDPPLDTLEGRKIEGVGRIGKMLRPDFSGDLSLLIHLMSAGRLQLFDKRASMKDRRSRLLVRIEGGRELRLREFGTRQSAWAKLYPSEAVAEDEMVATLGPEAWPAPQPQVFSESIRGENGHLHPLLRRQRVISGIGRTWVDEILWRAKLSPFKKGSELSDEEMAALHEALGVLGEAIDHYEDVIGETVPDKMPMPLQIHRREGEDCPRCGTTIEAIFYTDHQTNYCPHCQTGDKVMKDRRLSKLLK